LEFETETFGNQGAVAAPGISAAGTSGARIVVSTARRQNQQEDADQDWKCELPQLCHRIASSSFILSL
jgi:hypothetical protein